MIHLGVTGLEKTGFMLFLELLGGVERGGGVECFWLIEPVVVVLMS